VIPALVKGKLSREQENLEDILTSAVFGLLQYVPITSGLSRLLSFAIPFSKSPQPSFPSFGSDPQYEFWPWLKESDCLGCEPDVLITIKDSAGQMHILLIEAKFRSGKSSYPDNENLIPSDQLAREWDNLVSKCESKGAIPHLLYITADYGVPVQDLVESEKEFQQKRDNKTSQYPFACHWLSWNHISDAFEDASNPILKDLVTLSRRYGFGFYSGVTPITPMSNSVWKFSASHRVFNFWPSEVIFPKWGFRK